MLHILLVYSVSLCMSQGQYTSREPYECYLTLRRLLVKDWFIERMVIYALRYTQTLAMQEIEEIGSPLRDIVLMLEEILLHGAVKSRMLSSDHVLNPNIGPWHRLLVK